MAQALINAGVRPALKGNRLFLGKLVLVRADGEETKHAEEVRSLGVDVNFWERGTERKGNRVYGKDINGNRYMLSHHLLYAMAQALINAGVRPALKGNKLFLGKLVLVRAAGEETKHAEEVRSLGVDVNF